MTATAYTFAGSATDKIDCGTTPTHATDYSVAIRFVPHSLTGQHDLLAYMNATKFNTYLSLVGATVYAGHSYTAGGGGFTGAEWASGWSVDVQHTLVWTFKVTVGVSGDLYLYADTDSTAKDSVSGLATSLPDQDTDQHWIIGSRTGTTNSADATIQEVAWWPGTVLTGAQAAALGGGGPMAPGFPQPANYWFVAPDASDGIGAADGTITGATSATPTGTPWWSFSPPPFTVSARTEMANAAAISPTLDVWPDTAQGIVPAGAGSYTFVAASGGTGETGIGVAVGTFTNPLATSSDIVGLAGVKDAPDALVAAITYKGGGPVYVDPGSGLWLAIFHYEALVNPADPYPATQYYGWLGIAKSANSGATWTDCGAIITPYHSRQDMLDLWTTYGKSDGSWYNADLGSGSYLVVGPYLYVYFNYNDGAVQATGGLMYSGGYCVARALLADVVSAAQSTTVPVFHKWNGSNWTTEAGGLGAARGAAASLFDGNNAAMSYSIARGKYIAVDTWDWNSSGHLCINYHESADGLAWGQRATVELAATDPPSYRYPTLIDPGAPVSYWSGLQPYLTALSITNDDYSRWTLTMDLDPGIALVTLAHAGGERGD